MSKQMTDIFCRFIESAREYYGVSRTELVNGICSSSCLSGILSADRKFDKVMADALLQRLGRGNGNIEYVLNHTEYDLFVKRQEIRSYIENNDSGKARAAIKAYRKEKYSMGSERLHRQFACFAETHVMALEGAAFGEQYARVKEALELTMPEYGKRGCRERLLFSETELILALRMAQLQIMMGERIEGKKALRDLYGLLKNCWYDDNEMIHVFAPIIFYFAKVCLEDGEYDRAKRISDDGLRRLRHQPKPYYAAELRWINAMAARHCTCETRAGREVISYPMCHERNVRSLQQLIKERRILFGYTQEDLALLSGCDCKTVRRLESGRYNTQTDTIRKVLRTLKLSAQKFHMSIVTGSYIIQSEYKRAVTAAECGDPREARWLLSAIRQSIDPAIPENLQGLELLEYKILCREGRLTKEEGNKRLRKILSYTLPETRINSLGYCCLFKTEKTALRNLAIFRVPDTIICRQQSFFTTNQ